MSKQDFSPRDHSPAENSSAAQHEPLKPNYDIRSLMQSVPSLNDSSTKQQSLQGQQKEFEALSGYDDGLLSYHAARIAASNYDADYRAAKMGDKGEQDFIRKRLQEWHDLPQNASMRDYVNKIVEQLAYEDPAAGALFRKGIVDGGGSITFE